MDTWTINSSCSLWDWGSVVLTYSKCLRPLFSPSSSLEWVEEEQENQLGNKIKGTKYWDFISVSTVIDEERNTRSHHNKVWAQSLSWIWRKVERESGHQINLVDIRVCNPFGIWKAVWWVTILYSLGRTLVGRVDRTFYTH